MIKLSELPNQQRGEETRIFLRRHWIELMAMFVYKIGFAVLPIIFYILLSVNGVDWKTSFWGPVGAIMTSIYLLFAVLILLTMFTDYYLDTWIVTTERIVNIEQKGLFSRVISTLHLNQVQDVTSETHGFLATILSYGDVHIQTAGTTERFLFKKIDNPDDVKFHIMRLVDDDKRRHGDASRIPGSF